MKQPKHWEVSDLVHTVQKFPRNSLGVLKLAFFPAPIFDHFWRFRFFWLNLQRYQSTSVQAVIEQLEE